MPADTRPPRKNPQQAAEAPLLCGISTCGKPIRSRGYCASHYANLIRYGSPYGGWRDTVPPDFKGLGRIRCHICGKPVRDHAIGRCPEWT